MSATHIPPGQTPPWPDPPPGRPPSADSTGYDQQAGAVPQCILVNWNAILVGTYKIPCTFPVPSINVLDSKYLVHLNITIKISNNIYLNLSQFSSILRDFP